MIEWNRFSLGDAAVVEPATPWTIGHPKYALWLWALSDLWPDVGIDGESCNDGSYTDQLADSSSSAA